MQNYKVWLRARDPKTLEVVASVRVYNHEDRLAAEKVLETAQTRLQLLVLQLLHVHPGALVSTEMEHQLHDEHVTTVRGAAPILRGQRIAELEAALREALAKFDGEIHNEYDGTSVLPDRLAEVDHLRGLLK